MLFVNNLNSLEYKLNIIDSNNYIKLNIIESNQNQVLFLGYALWGN